MSIRTYALVTFKIRIWFIFQLENEVLGIVYLSMEIVRFFFSSIRLDCGYSMIEVK